MGKFKLKKSEYFKFINDSTYIGNINSGQVIPPNMYNSQETVKPIADSKKIVYNSNSNFIADNTKPQSNYMNVKNNVQKNI
jgi:hypothetical protein